MSMRRNSFIGAFHAASLQRQHSGVAVIFALFVALVPAILVAVATAIPLLFFLTEAVLSGIVIYFIGSYAFLVFSNVLNAIVIPFIAILLIAFANADPFIVIFVGIGVWVILYSMMWFSNNYFRYLIGFTEKETERLYRE